MSKKNKDPLEQIASGNKWYCDDQFDLQMGVMASRTVIEWRWEIFEQYIKYYLEEHESTFLDHPLRILDAGSGDGINLFGLLKIIKRNQWQSDLFGVDYNPLRLQRATSISGIQGLLRGRLQKLPFPDNTFQVVLCNHVLEHIPEEEEVLQEITRVLAYPGLLIIGVPNEGCLLARMRNHCLQRSKLKTTDHVNFYTEEKLRRSLRAFQLTVLKTEKEGFFFPHHFLQRVFYKYKAGRMLTRLLLKFFPGQAAELIVAAEKESSCSYER